MYVQSIYRCRVYKYEWNNNIGYCVEPIEMNDDDDSELPLTHSPLQPPPNRRPTYAAVSRGA